MRPRFLPTPKYPSSALLRVWSTSEVWQGRREHVSRLFPVDNSLPRKRPRSQAPGLDQEPEVTPRLQEVIVGMCRAVAAFARRLSNVATAPWLVIAANRTQQSGILTPDSTRSSAS